MSEELDATAALAYDAYRTAHAGTVAGGLPMPVWEHVSVPERDAWVAVAAAMAVPPLPEEDPLTLTPPPYTPNLWTQEDLEQLTVSDLREVLAAHDLSAPSSATKQQLIDVLLSARAAPTLEG